jgi:adenosylcobinamide-phosphate synthase
LSGVALAGGYLADVALGDPRRLHPVAGFGRLALWIERIGYAPTRRRGVAYACGLVASAALAGELAARAGARLGAGRSGALGIATWMALGGRSLTREATRLAGHLERDDLEAARAVLPRLCGRDPQGLDAQDLSRATVESVAENTADAVIGALMWGAVAGPGGVLAYRAANTLDAMVGHRSERYESFGWAAARLDDLLNWPVARLGVLLAAVCAPVVGGSPRTVWRITRRDGRAHPSPNAGRIEAAFAGALGVRLGGPLAYSGALQSRPHLGDGAPPTVVDVQRATRLSQAIAASAVLTCAVGRELLTHPGRGGAHA